MPTNKVKLLSLAKSFMCLKMSESFHQKNPDFCEVASVSCFVWSHEEKVPPDIKYLSPSRLSRLSRLDIMLFSGVGGHREESFGVEISESKV